MPNDDAPIDGRPGGENIHATAVAIAGQALLILGPSGSGKSRLALALIASSTRRRPVRLVGDDRILLTHGEQGLIARPHPRIEGFVERRGFGILATPFVASAPVGGIVLLGPAPRPNSGPKTATFALLQNFPCLRCVNSYEIDPAAVLRWWRGACTTPRMKASWTVSRGTKD